MDQHIALSSRKLNIINFNSAPGIQTAPAAIFHLIYTRFRAVTAPQQFQQPGPVDPVITPGNNIKMLDLLLSVLMLCYFPLSVQAPDTCFTLALVFNVLHLLTHLGVLLPILFRAGSLRRFRREQLKAMITSRYGMQVQAGVMVGLSLGCLYCMIVELFKWDNYSYLFMVFCVIGSSLSSVSNFVRRRFDCSLFFSIETYKFFCLAVASILFGISAHETKLSVELLGMGWAYFVYRSKQSLPKEIVYYLILFMDIVILLTAIMVIGTSQRNSQALTEEHIGRSKITLFISVTFFAALFCMQIYEFVQIYQTLGGQAKQSDDKYIEFYAKMQEFKSEAKEKTTNHLHHSECSICLENLSGAQRSQDVAILGCGHSFHFECLEEWALVNLTCPMCRRNILSGCADEIYV